MATKSLEKRLCEKCLKIHEEIKTRTLCYEGHELLCEPCLESLLRSKISKDHKHIELVQFSKKSTFVSSASPKLTSTSVDDGVLPSDLLKTVSHHAHTDDTVLCRGAQVAIESASIALKPTKLTKSKQTDHTTLKAIKCLEFSVKRSDDKERVYVRGILCLRDNVVIVDYFRKELKLFDKNGTYLSSTQLKDETWGITYVCKRTFATCGGNDTVYLWTIRGQTIILEDVSYHVDHRAHGIHYNGIFYCVLHGRDNAITILERQGKQVRKIIMEQACGKNFKFGWDIHMDSDTNNIHVPCVHQHGILCMTIEGQALWFTPLSGTWGITEIQGILCVVDDDSNCLHLVTKEGEYARKLVDKKDLGGRPKYVCYGQNERLYVTYDPGNTARVYTVPSNQGICTIS